jgi:beta-RFAP synthase
LEFHPAERLTIDGLERSRAMRTIDAWQTAYADELSERWGGHSDLLPVCIRKVAGPRAHAGLGSGTQLALALATGLHRMFLPGRLLTPESAVELGRGRRSAVGTYGFFLGGLIVDGGQQIAGELGQLVRNLPLPESWRVLLIMPTSAEGPAGDVEDALFERLPRSSPGENERLQVLALQRLVPAAEQGSFDEFSEAVYEFGYLAGLQFAAVQSGPFNGALVKAIVEEVRGSGIRGVGQSSWGPTVFALVSSEAEARERLADLDQRLAHLPVSCLLTRASRAGRVVSEVSESCTLSRTI